MVGVQEASRPSDGDYRYLFKMVLIGPACVGKTAMVLRFTDDSFTTTYNATIGVDFRTKTVHTRDNEVVKVQIWDTAGQERYRVISHSYYRGAHGVMLVFDITEESSFKSMDSFYTDIKERVFADCSVVLVGTNSDLKDRRQVTKQQAEDFASKNGIIYIEVSSKTGDDISRAFQILIEQMLKSESTKGTVGAMSSVAGALGNKAKAKTSPSTDEDSLHELENKSAMLESVRFMKSAKKSACCTIL